MTYLALWIWVISLPGSIQKDIFCISEYAKGNWCMCVYVLCVTDAHTYMCVQVLMPVSSREDQRTWVVLFCHFIPSIRVTKPRARLVASKLLSEPPFSTPNSSSEVTGTHAATFSFSHGCQVVVVPAFHVSTQEAQAGDLSLRPDWATEWVLGEIN